MTDRPPIEVVGRARERELLAVAADPRRTDGTVTVLAGEPGSGKSTLLDEVVGASSRRVLRTAGVESEAVLPFAAVADLLMPLLKHVEGLPEVQREALEIALALRAGTVGSPLAVCAAALGTFASAADAKPLLLVVDDFPWIDAPSQQVLMFVARRLAPERIALLLSVRSEVPVDPGIWRLPTIELGPLSADESRALVAALPVRASPRVVETIVERCAGNPLAVVEIARAAGPDLLVPDDAAMPALPPARRSSARGRRRSTPCLRRAGPRSRCSRTAGPRAGCSSSRCSATSASGARTWRPPSAAGSPSATARRCACATACSAP